MEYKNTNPLSKKIVENYDYISKKLGFGKSFDVGLREIIIRNKKVHFYYVNGLCDTEFIIEQITELLEVGEEHQNLHKQAFDIIHNHMVLHQVKLLDDIDDFITEVLSGLVGIIVEDSNKAIIIDVRSYPGRGPSEPETEKVVRGSRDGFTENIILNTALTRRRIRDPYLRNEIFKVGKYSKTDVCMTYIEGVADEKLVNEIRNRIKNVDVDELTMSDKKLEELIVKQKWNPYPKVRYTERPDILAVHLYQGLIGIFVDTSPSAMIAPTTLFEQLQHVEEYRQTPVVGSFLRLARTGGVFVSLFLVPVWLIAVYQNDMLPKAIQFIGPEKEGNVPIILQVLLGEVGIEFLRMAAIHTPTALSTALGIVAGILIGQIAVDVGLFSPEVVLYVAVSSLGAYATPTYEISLANKIAKLFLIIVTFIFSIWGFAHWGLLGSSLFLLIYLAFNNSFGKPYLYPLLPFNFKEFINIFIRVFATKQKERK